MFTDVNFLVFDVDWSHGAGHMLERHNITVTAADEALADLDALLFDPDPKSSSGDSVRVIGYSPSVAAVLVVILVHRDGGGWWGATAWRANATDRRMYREEQS